MTKIDILKRIFKAHNFSLASITLNINSLINAEGKKVFKNFNLKELTVDETIDEVIQNKKSLSRFGDGEIAIMTRDHGVGFQEKNDKLADRLFDVFTSSLPSHLVALPDQMLYINNSVRQTRKFWMSFLLKHEKFLLAHLKKDKIYGNTNITRFYMVFKDKVKASSRFEHLKKIWEGKDILIVEGEFSRSGIGNDLYKDAKSVKRILCPAKNAFNIYDKIFNETKKHGQDKLILLALGPTATVLAHDLALENYWALDLGHLDVEYMWMLNKSTSKTEIKGRYVNESANSHIEELDVNTLSDYNNQVVSKILN